MGYNTACVHRLAGFESVKLWHDRTKPIRGNKDNIRPLGSRRHHYMADIHMPDENTAHLRYYGQTLVEWRSDNTYTVFPPKYYSAYTPDNIHNFLPNHGQGFVWDRGRMFYADTKEKAVVLKNKIIAAYVEVNVAPLVDVQEEITSEDGSVVSGKIEL